jgi:hypothetical protein
VTQHRLWDGRAVTPSRPVIQASADSLNLPIDLAKLGATSFKVHIAAVNGG